MHPQRGLTLQTHRYKLRSTTNCCVGSEIVDWLLVQDKATSRIQAVAIGQALIDASYLQCLSNTEQSFIDGYSLYRPKSSDTISLTEQPAQIDDATAVGDVDDTQEPLWVRQIGMHEDTNHVDMQQSMMSTQSVESIDSFNDNNHLDMINSLKSLHPAELNPLPLLNSPTYHQVEFSPQTKESKMLNDLFDEHTQRLMKQLLSSQGLSLSWADVLMPLVNALAFTVRPDVKNDDDDLDIRQYIHLKKVPGGSKSDSRIIHGVVCSKNVANRSMAKRIHDPNILLLSSAIDYQRVESKLISLEPLMMQVPHVDYITAIHLTFNILNWFFNPFQHLIIHITNTHMLLPQAANTYCWYTWIILAPWPGLFNIGGKA